MSILDYLSGLGDDALGLVEDVTDSIGNKDTFNLKFYDSNEKEITDPDKIKETSEKLSNFQSGFGLGTDSPEAYDAFKDQTGITVSIESDKSLDKALEETITQLTNYSSEEDQPLADPAKPSDFKGQRATRIGYGREKTYESLPPSYLLPPLLQDSRSYNRAIPGLLSQTRTPTSRRFIESISSLLG